MCRLSGLPWLPRGGCSLERSAGPCPSNYLTVRRSLSAGVVPHPATWPLRKAVVLSKEGAQLFETSFFFQFSLPLIFPWKAGLVKCLRAAFWENHCSLESQFSGLHPQWPRLLGSQLLLHSHCLLCFFHSCISLYNF